MHQEQQKVAAVMAQQPGAFVSRLGQALEAATPEQAKAIRKAFPDLWARYLREATDGQRRFPFAI